MSLRDIGKQLGVSFMTVRRELNRAAAGCNPNGCFSYSPLFNSVDFPSPK
jgi:IS30 family transposase